MHELTAAAVACRERCYQCGVQRRHQTNARERIHNCDSLRCCHLCSCAPPTHRLPEYPHNRRLHFTPRHFTETISIFAINNTASGYIHTDMSPNFSHMSVALKVTRTSIKTCNSVAIRHLVKLLTRNTLLRKLYSTISSMLLTEYIATDWKIVSYIYYVQ